MNNTFPIHIRTVTGLEESLAKELTALGAKNPQVKSRLVVCHGDKALLYKANLWCRTAIRVLRPIASLPVRDEKAFYALMREIDWSRWMSHTGTLAVNANVHSSFTTHSLFLAQLAKDAVVDQFREKTGERPSVDLKEPDLRIGVTLYQDNAEIYVDSSGESLHKRGYRQRAGEAPLNETLAAGIVKLSGWDGKKPFLDPMCGSGTLPIEAGMLAKNIAPGLLRKYFGFQGWPDYDRTLYETLLTEAKHAIRKDVNVSIIGVEIDPKMIKIARDNVERAGLADVVRIEEGDFFTWTPEGAGTVVMNPPYDERLQLANVGEFWQQIGDRLKQSYPGWTASVLCGNPDAIKHVRLRTSQRIPLYNGSMECRLFQYELSEGGPLAAPQKMDESNPKWQEKAQTLGNRIRKTVKHYAKQARREEVTAWRVYDRDIPELPFLLDLYGDKLHFAEVPRNYDHTLAEHQTFLQMMMKAAAEALGIPIENVFLKKRKPPGSAAPGETGEFIEVEEAGHRFLVNLTDYVDVGLFLEQRKLRALIKSVASGKDFLNLFAYTGSLSVYAAAGGASSTTSVDSSRPYLEWAERNLKLNGFSGAKHRFERSDVMEFLEKNDASYDLCVIDPPTNSVNRTTGQTFNVQSDHRYLLRLLLNRLRPNGSLYFTTNYQTFKLDEVALKDAQTLHIEEITTQLVPFDFERRPNYRTWLLRKG